MPIEISELKRARPCQTAAIISAITEAIVVTSTTIVMSFRRERVLPSTALTSLWRSLELLTASAAPGGRARSISVLVAGIDAPGASATASCVRWSCPTAARVRRRS